MDNGGGGFTTGVIITIIVISIFWGIGKNGKYEGLKAYEWYDETSAAEDNYDKCKEELDAIDTNLLEFGDCINEVVVFNRNIVQKCLKDGQFTQAQCVNVALELANQSPNQQYQCYKTYIESK